MEIETNGNYFIIPNGRQQIPLNVNVSGSTSSVQASKDVSITSNGTTTVNPDEGYDSMATVVIDTNVPSVISTVEITKIKWTPSGGTETIYDLSDYVTTGGSSTSFDSHTVYMTSGDDYIHYEIPSGSTTTTPPAKYLRVRNVYTPVYLCDNDGNNLFRIGTGDSCTAYRFKFPALD